jgi:hypothetical protein
MKLGIILGLFLTLAALLTVGWLDRQPPVLSRSGEKDPLSRQPLRVIFNPVRDRAPERVADGTLNAMRDGRCPEELAAWLHDYRRSYAEFICNAERQHPLLWYKLFDREERPPLVILQYKVSRKDGARLYQEDLFVTTQRTDSGGWTVTRYGALY